MVTYGNIFGEKASGGRFKNAVLDGAAFSFTTIPIGDLTTGQTVTSRCVAVVPAGYVLAVDSVNVLPDASGADTTITTAATCVIALKDESGNTLVTKTYASTGSFVAGSLGTVTKAYATIEENRKLYLTITNAATVLLPDFFLQIGGTVSKVK